jgi:Hypothetical glycosyl hydrolase family 15
LHYSGFQVPVLSLAIISLLVVGQVQAAEPEVSNILVQQRTDGSKLVDISYDLFDSDADTMFITLNFSVNGGQSWEYPVFGISGDVGAGIISGTDKNAVWNCALIPNGVNLVDFRVQIIASDKGVQHQVHSPDNVAIMDFSPVDWSDPEIIEKFSRADLCQIEASTFLNGGVYAHLPVVEQLKALNPNLKIVDYVSVKSAKLSGAYETSAPFWQDWFERTREYWAYTTEGDTVSDWPGNVVLNILEPGCRDAMVQTIIEYHGTSSNQVDGIFWDYFNNKIWIPDFIELEGEPDLDNDGVAHNSDPDELLAYQNAQIALIQAVRDSLGEDYLMIFNGQRSYHDSSFANLADGIMYEIFPTLHFPDPNMAHALDPNYEFNLFEVRSWLRTVNGEPYLLMSNPTTSRYYDYLGEVTILETGNQFRAVALLVDGYSCWNTNSGSSFNYVYGWTNNEISLGTPIGPTTFEDNFLRRDFEYGKVEIEMTNGAFPNPFDYRIWALGQIVEELDIPYHHP